MARFRATPYARALYDLMTDTAADRREAAAGELERVARALAEVPQLERAMVVPVLSQDAKTALLDQVLDSLAVTRPTRDLVHVVQRHYRLEHLAAISTAFQELVDRGLGRVRATVELAADAEEGDRRALLDAVAAVMDATVVADFVQRPELLAGFRVQVGSKVFDASLVGQLEQLRRQTQMEQR